MYAAIALLIACLVVLLGFDVPPKVVVIGAVGFFVFAVIDLIRWLVSLPRNPRT